jgi:hypothetical protein
MVVKERRVWHVLISKRASNRMTFKTVFLNVHICGYMYDLIWNVPWRLRCSRLGCQLVGFVCVCLSVCCVGTFWKCLVHQDSDFINWALTHRWSHKLMTLLDRGGHSGGGTQLEEVGHWGCAQLLSLFASWLPWGGQLLVLIPTVTFCLTSGPKQWIHGLKPWFKISLWS